MSLQRGPTEGTAKVFLITQASIEEVAGLIDEPRNLSQLLRTILERSEELSAQEMTEAAIERIGLVAHHLFAGKQPKGAFIKLAELEEKSLERAWRELAKQKAPQEAEGEGVLKELQAM